MIKKLDPKMRFRIVAQVDEAIDRTDAEWKNRYAQYLETFDLSALKMKEGCAPTFFILRPLTSLELADFNSRYLEVDAEKKTAGYKDQAKMFLEMFDLCVEGMQDGDGAIEKVSSSEVPYLVAGEIGSIVSMIATLGKNLKKA